MAWKVDKRIPKDLFIKLMIKKANVIKDHLKNSINQLIIVANIGPTMATFKIYDIKEEDSLKLHMTLSNLGDIEDQICQLWQQLNFCCNNIVLNVKVTTPMKIVYLIWNCKLG